MTFKRTLVGLGFIILAAVALAPVIRADEAPASNNDVSTASALEVTPPGSLPGMTGASSPVDLLKPVFTGAQNPSLPSAGIFRIGGQVFIDRAVNLNSLTTSSATISSATITAATITTNNVTTLKFADATSQTTAAGTSHLLQVPVFASETTGGSNATTSFTNLGASVSITPTSTSSTIYIFGGARVRNSLANGTTVMGVNGTTTGDLVTTANSPFEASNNSGVANQEITLTGFFKDTPGTLTTQTYKLRFAANNGGTSLVGNSVATGAQTYIMAFEVK